MSGPHIGVFDSGFGGLTVLRALLPLLPGARYTYLGDTARLPYGSKSRETVARYALSAAQFLQARGAEFLVIACNTATALALPELQAALPIPVLGVVEPGAAAARAAEVPGTVLVLATAATVASHAYSAALADLGLAAVEQACPLLVPLVEEGWIGTPGEPGPAREAVTREVLRLYLAEALEAAPDAGTLLLGCTHYPLLRPLIADTLGQLGRPLRIIDSAEATAAALAAEIGAAAPELSSPADPETVCEFYATDSVAKFRRLGSHFLGRALPEVHLLDLGG